LAPRLLAFGCRFKELNFALLCENFSDEFPDSTGSPHCAEASTKGKSEQVTRQLQPLVPSDTHTP
jgi:hypothetical protein